MLWASWATVEASAPELQAEAAHEAEPHAPGAVVALDDGDLREVATRIRYRVAVDDRRLLDELLRDDLVLDETDHPRSTSAPRDAEVAGRDRLHANRVLHPLGHVRLRDVLDGSARLEHGARLEGLEVVEHDEIGLVAGRDRAEVVEAVPEAGFSEASTSASSGATPAATALRTIWLRCPESAMSSGSRSSVQNAIRDGPNSCTSGSRSSRFRAIDASRISSHMPARRRCRPSSTVSAS